MSRFIPTIVLATLFSGTLLAQTADPVADLTRQVINRFVPSLAAPIAAPSDGTPNYGAPNYGAMSFGVTSSAATSYRTEDSIKGSTNTEDLLPRHFAPMPLLPQIQIPFRRDLNLRLKPRTPALLAPLPVENALPRPLSLSAASTNGIHAIQAVVPTEKGQQRVELNGTKAQIETQLKGLSPQVRQIMSRSLGL